MDPDFRVLSHQVKHSSRSVEGVMSTSTSETSLAAAATGSDTGAVFAIRLVVARKFVMGPKLCLVA